MAVLLTIEGIKSAFLLPDAFPYDSDWEWLWDYLWVFKIEVFFYAHTAAILLYLCLPIYYRIEKRFSCSTQRVEAKTCVVPCSSDRFGHLDVRSRHERVLHGEFSVVDLHRGVRARSRYGSGSVQPFMTDTVEQIGTCTAYYEVHLVDDSTAGGLWAIALASPLVTLGALFFIRASMKSEKAAGDKGRSRHLTSRSLYIGFLGKVSGTMLYWSLDGHHSTPQRWKHGHLCSIDALEVRRRRLVA